ncbi:MAG: DUF6265 family protein [Proteobacteria bacterium]|nr:DUF6265 family protein [Pseudomonadota bacterium]MCL2308140.1 DUF6265 family protein [Pseudomonadota bacterium]
MNKPFSFLKNATLLLPALLLGACAQTPLKSEPPPTATADATPAAVAPQPTENKQEATGPLAPLAWLEGCWRGNVNQREFREHWLPLRGDMLLGISHTVLGDKTQDHQFLRMDVRDDAVHYTITAPDEQEHRFRFSGETADQEDTIYKFSNVADVFPQTVSYRRASGGWMYITVEGKLNGADRKVIYPIRRIACESGEFINR